MIDLSNDCRYQFLGSKVFATDDGNFRNFGSNEYCFKFTDENQVGLDFPLKMLNFALEMMDFAFKMMDFALKMMDFAL